MENDKDLETRNGNQNRLLEFSDNGIDNLAIVKFTEAVQSDGPPSSTGCKLDDESTLLIPHLLIGDETFDVKVREVGLGKIAARFLETYNTLNGNGIKRIWCEWLGKENNNQQDGEVLEHDYAVVIFPYNYDLGRSGLLDDDDVKSLLPSASITEPENIRERGRKRKAPSSDPEDMSDSLSKQYDSSADESSVTSVDHCDNQLLRTKFISSKAVRKELRRQQRLASEKVCNICQQKMLPGKDVAALLNLKTGRLACSSRNRTGVHPNVRKGGNRKVASNCSNIGKEKDMEAATAHIETVFCPECQGHGLTIDGDGVEHPDFFSLSQMFKFKIKACDARIEWTKSPENLQTCSIGLHFPSEFEGIVEVF
ncbi:hypothetical protein SESBI_05424 [Sesbania bispinosa]|nr:hypothetical protein SESBI_05424 [Sesbania bispinosa]